MSTDIGVVTGKIVGALATMKLSMVAGAGIRNFHLLDDAQAIKTTLAAVYTAADIANNTYQAVSGEKTSGEAIGWAERIAAALGAAGGVQGFRAALALQKTPMETLRHLAEADPAIMRGVLTEQEALARLASIERAMPDPVIKAGLADKVAAYRAQFGAAMRDPNSVMGVGGGVAKSVGASIKPEAEAEVAKMSDVRVRDQSRRIARANAHIPEVQAIRAIVYDNDRLRTSAELHAQMDDLRTALAAYLSLSLDTDNQAAAPLSVITLGMGR